MYAQEVGIPLRLRRGGGIQSTTRFGENTPPDSINEIIRQIVLNSL